MLYKKNNEPFCEDLFKNPTCEYRAAPFWAWNCKLDKDELCRQIEVLKTMGFGGFHMHSRAGMATEYLSEDFMKLVKICTDKAKQEKMLAWLYDEDRWPSGTAGGFVTKTPEHRGKTLTFSKKPMKSVSAEEGYHEGEPYLFGCYSINLEADGTLESYKLIGEDEKAESKWYAYITALPTGDGWYNGQCYVDTLSKKAIDRFIEITYTAYEKAVGDEFDKTIRTIFTDEPNFSSMQAFEFASSEKTVCVPWTTGLEDTFTAAYGIDLKEKLPEVFWNLPSDAPSRNKAVITNSTYFKVAVASRFQ